MPHLSVAAGVLLAVASLAVLIFFIHHTAHAIRLETILADLAQETREAVERLYPEDDRRGALSGRRPSSPARLRPRRSRRSAPAWAVTCRSSTTSRSWRWPREHDLVLRLEASPAASSSTASRCSRPGRATARRTTLADGAGGRDRGGRRAHAAGRTSTSRSGASSRSPSGRSRPGINDPTTALLLHRPAARGAGAPGAPRAALAPAVGRGRPRQAGHGGPGRPARWRARPSRRWHATAWATPTWSVTCCPRSRAVAAEETARGTADAGGAGATASAPRPPRRRRPSTAARQPGVAPEAGRVGPDLRGARCALPPHAGSGPAPRW